jgi:hypothetical protein
MAAGTKSFVLTTVDRTNTVAQQPVAPPIALIRATPLGNFFTESQADLAIQARDSQAQRLTKQAVRQADAYIPTNR